MFKAMQQIDPQPIRQDAIKRTSIFLQRPSLTKNMNPPENPERPLPNQQAFFVQSRFKDKPEWHEIQSGPNPQHDQHNQLGNNVGNPTTNFVQPHSSNNEIRQNSQNSWASVQNQGMGLQVNYNRQQSSNFNNNIGSTNHHLLPNANTSDSNGTQNYAQPPTTNFQFSNIDNSNTHNSGKKHKHSSIGVLTNKQSLYATSQEFAANPGQHHQARQEPVRTQPLECPPEIPCGNQIQQPNLQQEFVDPLQGYVKFAVDGLLVPYAHLLAQKKVEQEMKRKTVREQKRYANSMQYFWNKWDEFDSSQLHNPRQAEKRRKKETIVVKVITKPKQVKMQMQNEQREYVSKWRHEYYKEKYGEADPNFNYQLKDRINAQDRNNRFPRQKMLQESMIEENWKEVTVSDFGETRSLEYSVDLRWIEEPQKVRKVLKKSTVKVIDNPSEKQIEEAIMLDLKLAGLLLQKNALFELKKIQPKTYKPNILMRIFFGSKEKQLDDYVATGTIFQRKVSLPSDYEYQPSRFEGFIVQNLTIKNMFGSIIWPGGTNIQNVNLEAGISIRKHQVQCNLPVLEKQAVVQFFGFPFDVQNKTRLAISEGLRKRARGATLLCFDLEKNSWKLHLDFSKQQSEAQRQFQQKIA